jgi:hypothetical protein
LSVTAAGIFCDAGPKNGAIKKGIWKRFQMAGLQRKHGKYCPRQASKMTGLLAFARRRWARSNPVFEQ